MPVNIGFGFFRDPTTGRLTVTPAPTNTAAFASPYSSGAKAQYAAQLAPLADLYGSAQTSALMNQLNVPMPDYSGINWADMSQRDGDNQRRTGSDETQRANDLLNNGFGQTSGLGNTTGLNSGGGSLVGDYFVGQNNPGGLQPDTFNPNPSIDFGDNGGGLMAWLRENAGGIGAGIGGFLGGMTGLPMGAQLGAQAGRAVGGSVDPSSPINTVTSWTPTGGFNSPNNLTLNQGGYQFGDSYMFAPNGADAFMAGGGFGFGNIGVPVADLPPPPSDMTLGDLINAPLTGGTSPIPIPGAPQQGYVNVPGAPMMPISGYSGSNAGSIAGGNYGGMGQQESDAAHYWDRLFNRWRNQNS